MINNDFFRENPMSNHLLIEEIYSKQIQLFSRLLFFYSLSTILNFNFSVECGIRTFRISIFCLRQTPVQSNAIEYYPEIGRSIAIRLRSTIESQLFNYVRLRSIGSIAIFVQSRLIDIVWTYHVR